MHELATSCTGGHVAGESLPWNAHSVPSGDFSLRYLQIGLRKTDMPQQSPNVCCWGNSVAKVGSCSGLNFWRKIKISASSHSAFDADR
jgi:hypothetical protein